MDPTRVLHIEDDKSQRAIVAHFLNEQQEKQYVVTGVESEDDAVNAFRRGGFDLVILDYQLAQGDGLNCLRQLRQIDATVPVIAVSCTATPAIVAELIEVGADDYLSKESLNKNTLAESIETALTRAQGIRAKVGEAALRVIE